MTNQITFRFVRAIYTTSKTISGDATWDCKHRTFVYDETGDWIEKDYNNGCKSYKMAADCNQAAVAKLRLPV